LQRDNRRYGHMKDRILISDAIRVVWKWMSAAWISTYGICMVSCDLSSVTFCSISSRKILLLPVINNCHICKRKLSFKDFQFFVFNVILISFFLLICFCLPNY
jgi:hypothetical protein